VDFVIVFEIVVREMTGIFPPPASGYPVVTMWIFAFFCSKNKNKSAKIYVRWTCIAAPKQSLWMCLSCQNPA
jgi:hypothetical protein